MIADVFVDVGGLRVEVVVEVDVPLVVGGCVITGSAVVEVVGFVVLLEVTFVVMGFVIMGLAVVGLGSIVKVVGFRVVAFTMMGLVVVCLSSWYFCKEGLLN